MQAIELKVTDSLFYIDGDEIKSTIILQKEDVPHYTGRKTTAASKNVPAYFRVAVGSSEIEKPDNRAIIFNTRQGHAVFAPDREVSTNALFFTTHEAAFQAIKNVAKFKERSLESEINITRNKLVSLIQERNQLQQKLLSLQQEAVPA